eukprot:scaffold4803_cov104-Isochrysis_galbana.AAC.3
MLDTRLLCPPRPVTVPHTQLRRWWRGHHPRRWSACAATRKRAPRRGHAEPRLARRASVRARPRATSAGARRAGRCTGRAGRRRTRRRRTRGRTRALVDGPRAGQRAAAALDGGLDDGGGASLRLELDAGLAPLGREEARVQELVTDGDT